MEANNPQQLSLVDGGYSKYCIDSNVFFSFWSDRRRFPVETYRPLWDMMEQKMRARAIISSEEVYREIKDHNNAEFQNWLRQIKELLFLDNNQAIVESAQEIVNAYPQIYFQKPKNGADPFIIALARVYDLTLITEESAVSDADLRSGRCPAIPNLCDVYNVKCVDVLGFCREEGFELGPIQIK